MKVAIGLCQDRARHIFRLVGKKANKAVEFTDTPCDGHAPTHSGGVDSSGELLASCDVHAPTYSGGGKGSAMPQNDVSSLHHGRRSMRRVGKG